MKGSMTAPDVGSSRSTVGVRLGLVYVFRVCCLREGLCASVARLPVRAMSARAPQSCR